MDRMAVLYICSFTKMHNKLQRKFSLPLVYKSFSELMWRRYVDYYDEIISVKGESDFIFHMQGFLFCSQP